MKPHITASDFTELVTLPLNLSEISFESRSLFALVGSSLLLAHNKSRQQTTHASTHASPPPGCLYRRRWRDAAATAGHTSALAAFRRFSARNCIQCCVFEKQMRSLLMKLRMRERERERERGRSKVKDRHISIQRTFHHNDPQSRLLFTSTSCHCRSSPPLLQFSSPVSFLGLHHHSLLLLLLLFIAVLASESCSHSASPPLPQRLKPR